MSNNGKFKIETKVGEFELLTSATVHLVDDQDVVVSIDDMRFKFKFVNNDGPPKYTGAVVDNTLEISLLNHKNSLGEGLLKPTEVATFDDRKLYITYYVHTVDLEKGIRRFEYAFYLGSVA